MDDLTPEQVFLSTLSLRRATHFKCWHTKQRLYFYPRSPCGERRRGSTKSSYIIIISIHALLAESDALVRSGDADTRDFYPRSPCGERRGQNACVRDYEYFYPRSPCGERPLGCGWKCFPFVISIHALLAESDDLCSTLIHELRDFYPRSPCGERPEADAPKTPKQGFLSTLSLRRATVLLNFLTIVMIFLSTLSLRRATKKVLAKVLH